MAESCESHQLLSGFSKLPPEILCEIAVYLRPRPYPSVHPHPQAQTLDLWTVVVPAQRAIQDLLALAYTCKKCYLAVLSELYHAPALLQARQVRLLAQTLNQGHVGDLLDKDEFHASHQPRHLFLPNDGLLVASDSLWDQSQWALSLRTLFRYCKRLESVVVGARSDGTNLSEFFDDEVNCRLQRITILNFYASPPFSMWNLKPLSELTHLHFINLIPKTPILQMLAGTHPVHSEPGPSTVTHIRLSQLHPDALMNFELYVDYRRAFDEWEALPPTRRRDPPLRPVGVPTKRFEAQETLFTLATSVATMPAFKCLLLELGELGSLDAPHYIRGLYAAYDEVDISGQDTTIGPSHLQIAAAMPDPAHEALLARSRTAPRDEYWMLTRMGKETLQDLFNETRSAAVAASDSDDQSSTRLPPIEVRVVAPRSGGWDQNEMRQDFEAQVLACERQSRRRTPHLTCPSSEEAHPLGDGTCYSDMDVFWLAQHRPWLGYEGRRRRDWDGKGDWREVSEAMTDWWTGRLPRFDAAATQITDEERRAAMRLGTWNDHRLLLEAQAEVNTQLQ